MGSVLLLTWSNKVGTKAGDMLGHQSFFNLQNDGYICLGIFSGLPIFSVHCCNPAISPISIDRETIEVESTAFIESILASHRPWDAKIAMAQQHFPIGHQVKIKLKI